MRFLLRSLMANCPFRIPIAAGGVRTESTSAFSRDTCLTSGRHSNRAQNRNIQLTHNAYVNASDRQFHPSIYTNNGK